MEIMRHLLILVFLHLEGFCCLVNSTKKKKLLAQPHGRHVANKRGLSTLFDPHGLNGSNPSIGHGEMINVEKSPEDSRLVPFENSGIISKAAKKKKRRKRLKSSKYPRIMFMKSSKTLKCKNWSDCKEGQCCIRNKRNRGHCKSRPRKGERCKPDVLPGLESCPCDKGLTCFGHKSNRPGYKKYRCRLLNTIEDEKEQRFL